ncbi:MAG: putative metal-binding motif-containing protein [Myxococcota bacterium]
MRHLLLLPCAVALGCSAPAPLPVLTEVAPGQVDAVLGGPVELRGAHLRPAVTLDFDRPGASSVHADFTAWLEGGGARVDLLDVAWVQDGVVSARAPGGLAEGRYDVHLVDPAGHESVLAGGLEVVDCFVTACVLPDGGTLDAGAVDAGTQTPWTECGDFTFADIDLDTFGRPDSGAFLCGPYRTSVDGDCNDRDGLAHPGAPEVCNGIDDDCDGDVDEGVCATDGGPTWARVYQSGPTWKSAWSWTRGGLWVGGEDDVRVTTDGRSFSRVGDNCPGNIAAVWAAPSGRAYVGGGTPGMARIAGHAVGTSACEAATGFSDGIAALVGFSDGDGGAHLLGLLRKGALVRGRDGFDASEYPSNLPSNYRFTDVHGVAPGVLYAVGYDSSGARSIMKAYRLGADGGWVDERVERLGLPRGALHGVWVLDAERVVAVGDQGVVIERTPFGWFRLPEVPGEDLTSVRAFSLGRVYVVGDQGAVRLWNGYDWQLRYDGGVALEDITGTAEDDLWAVGRGGAVVHWPEPR